MNSMKLFELLDNIDDKYIVDSRIQPAPALVAAGEHHFGSFFKSAVSVAAMLLIVGAVFVWTLVGKDLIGAHQGRDTTNATTTEDPQTTPDTSTTTNNGIVAPITTTVPTTTEPITTTPITTVPDLDIRTIDPQRVNFDHLELISYNLDWQSRESYNGYAYRILNLSKYHFDLDLQSYIKELPRGFLNQSFYNVGGIDFRTLLICMDDNTVANEEFMEVADVIIKKECYDKWNLLAGGSIYKITTEGINEVLSKYFHTSLTDDMKKTLKEQFFYLEKYDAYYASEYPIYGSFLNPKVEKAWIAENGNIVMMVSDAGYYQDKYIAHRLSVVVLKKDTNGQWILDQVMEIPIDMIKNLYPNADTSILEEKQTEIIRLIKDSGISSLTGYSSVGLADIEKIFKLLGNGYMDNVLNLDIFLDSGDMDVSKIISSIPGGNITEDELKVFLKIKYEKEKDKTISFEEYYKKMSDFDYCCCTTSEINDIILKLFGFSFDDEMKECVINKNEVTYVEEYDKFYYYADSSYIFYDFGGFKFGEQLILIIPSYEDDIAKAIVLSPLGDSYVISQITTIEY